MDKVPAKKCCGGITSKGYSTEPETIDIRPFNTSYEDRQKQLDHMNHQFKLDLIALAARDNRKKKQAILTPLFDLLEKLDHQDPANASLIADIKRQLAGLAQGTGSEGSKTEDKPKSALRNPSAFRLKSNPPTPSEHSSATPPSGSECRSFGGISTPDSAQAEETSFFGGSRHAITGCDNFFSYITDLFKPLIATISQHDLLKTVFKSEPVANEAEESASQGQANTEAVATHNHSASQPCRPTCWAFDASTLATTQAYMTQAKKATPAKPKSVRLEPIVHGQGMTTSLRVPIHFTGI